MNFLTKLFDTYNKGLLYDQLVIDNGEDELLVLKYQKASNSYKKEIIDLKDDISDYELEIKVLHKDLDDATKVEPLVAKPKFLFGMAVYRARRSASAEDTTEYNVTHDGSTWTDTGYSKTFTPDTGVNNILRGLKK